MSGAVTVVSLAVVAVMALALEGTTTLRCSGAALPDGSRRLTQLGSGFLASEVWVVALLGLGHAAVPGWIEAPTLLVPLCTYVAGWILRDLGLWFGPRGAWQTPWRAVVTVGAAIQALAVVIGFVGVLLEISRGGVPARFDPDPLLAPMAAVALLATLSLQILWWVTLRSTGSEWFRWS